MGNMHSEDPWACHVNTETKSEVIVCGVGGELAPSCSMQVGSYDSALHRGSEQVVSTPAQGLGW